MRLISTAYLLIVTGIFIISDLPLAQENVLQDKNEKIPEIVENSPPEVAILYPSHNEEFTWDDHIRYEIRVSDAEDGESRYDEIESNEVLMEVEYLNVEEELIKEEKIQKLKGDKEAVGLFLIKTSGCFGCHRDKSSMVGPSFSDIAQRYEAGPKTIEKLGNSIVEGSSGKWGSTVMPPQDQFTSEEARQMALFILEQGGNNDRLIYPGLEGVIRIIGKPVGESGGGVIVLTASYTDHGVNSDFQSRKRGSHSIMIKIR